jgi:transposase
MTHLELKPSEKLALELKHKQCKHVKECYRINAVLLRSEGWAIPMIAQALRIHENTVTRHINDYQNGKLTISSGGSSSLLNDVQTKELVTHLELHTYKTTLEITAYIKAKYGISYTVPGLNKWLHRNGFSYKKPKGFPHKACPAQQQKFIKYYSKLAAKIPPKDGIMFMDSCHPSMATKVSYGWIKKGQSKPIETTASRTRMNLVGALSLEQIDAPVIANYSTVDSEAIVDFLHQLRKFSTISGKIHLVADKAGYHRSLEVRRAAKKLNINLIYLPAYSPNLNPIERLWKVMNEHSRNNKFFKTAQEFRQSIYDFFSKVLPKIAPSLGTRINDNFQSLDYAF